MLAPAGTHLVGDDVFGADDLGEMVANVTAPTAGLVRIPHRWRALGVICLCVTVIVVDNTILNVALPSIERGLHATATQLQWMVDAYTLTFASLLLVAGNLGDLPVSSALAGDTSKWSGTRAQTARSMIWA
jgi:MFS family permease